MYMVIREDAEICEETSVHDNHTVTRSRLAYIFINKLQLDSIDLLLTFWMICDKVLVSMFVAMLECFFEMKYRLFI